jgi:hypothetical protein
MWAKNRSRSAFVPLAVLLALAVAALLVQLFQSLWSIGALDVRNWPRETWMALNLGVVLVLFGIRLGPEVRAQWRNRRTRRTIEREQQKKQRTLNEQREVFERLREARKRQVV